MDGSGVYLLHLADAAAGSWLRNDQGEAAGTHGSGSHRYTTDTNHINTMDCSWTVRHNVTHEHTHMQQTTNKQSSSRRYP